MKISVLNEGQIEDLRSSTEYLLKNTGFRVSHPKILKLAAKAGAKVDAENEVISFPPELLRELLAQVPRRYTIKTIDGKEFAVGSGGQVCTAIVTDPWIIDYKTNMPRKPGLEDIRRHTIIAQRLEDVASVSRMDYPVAEYADATSSLRALEVHLLNHTKHYMVCPATVESFRQWLELAGILSGGRSVANSGLLSTGIAVVSPLVLNRLNAELLLETTANSFTVIPTICPMAGSTSPYSKDATLLLSNAENVFLAAMTQLLNAGNPFLYVGGLSRMDMKTGYDMYYTLDKVLWKIASVELAKSYGFPVTAECGGSMSYRYDQQNGAESALFMLSAQNSGADVLAGIGSCYNAVGMSAEMMLIQSEWLRAARFLTKGLSTENLHKGAESISRAGPGGNFLVDELTLELLRSGEFYSPALLDYSGGEGAAPSMLQNAHEKVEEMVAGYRSPVPERVQRELREYFERLYRAAE